MKVELLCSSEYKTILTCIEYVVPMMAIVYIKLTHTCRDVIRAGILKSLQVVDIEI